MRRPRLRQVPTGATSTPTMGRWSEARTTVRASTGTSPDELRPDELTRACTRMLRVAGAGVSLMSDDLRVPLGASDDTASLAERLQFTAGSGPCWVAESTGRPVRVSSADMEQRWPRFAASLLERTPYRSIVSVPLPGLGGGWGGALDLYLDQPTRAYVFGVGEACVVAELVAAELRAALDDGRPGTRHAPGSSLATATSTVPSMSASPGTLMSTWLALGMVAVERDTSAQGALTLVREHASEASANLTAQRILDGSLGSGDLRPAPAAALAVAV